MFWGYIGAVASSIILAVGLNKAFLPITNWMSGSKKLIMSTLFNWIACSAANASNIILMRNKELNEGITITDIDGKEYGKSVETGKLALMQTVSSRMIIPFVVMFGPALVLAFMKLWGLTPRNKLAGVFLEVFLCAGALTVSLPCAIAALP